jgi:hypothetical protein
MAGKSLGWYDPAKMDRVIVLEDCNFIWEAKELREMVKLWKSGMSVETMAEHFERDPDEVLLAIIHLAKDKRISGRKGGAFGWL